MLHNIPKWIEIAVSYLGQAEIPGPESNKYIAEWLASVGLPGIDEIANCAAFVNFCLVGAGLTGTGKPNAKSYLTYGIHCEPRIGAIAVHNRGTDPAKGHVNFVLDYQPVRGLVYLIGANQGDRVGVDLKYKNIALDYRWPIGG